jgi:hypothetical protein
MVFGTSGVLANPSQYPFRRCSVQKYNTAAELGLSPTIPTVAIPAAIATTIATTAVQPCPYSTAAVVFHQQLPILQLWEAGPLCSRMPPAQGKQLAVSSGTHGQSAEGPSEGSCTMDGLRQLHHCGGDSHGRGSASEYVLPQRTSRYYSVRFRSIA